MKQKMLNFTVGPVQMNEEIRELGKEEIPYFRTENFSKIMKENERLICKLAGASENSRAVFLTGSGTLSMEASILNCFTEEDKLLIINGGSFGERFVEICKIYKIPYIEIKLEYGETLEKNELEKYKNSGITGFLVNIHETSTGVLYDIKMISQFCKENNIFLIVDAISSFISDEINFFDSKIDVMIIGSQKALATPPGISILVLSDKAVNRINNRDVKSLYLNLKKALKEGERGQTPFTPAVSILLQLNLRLKKIDQIGIEEERKKIKRIADDFRERVKELPFAVFSKKMSNTLTALNSPKKSAYEIFKTLESEYGIWVCPNGGELRDKVFRVGHIGNITIEDNKMLIEALKDMKRRDLL